MTRLSPRIALLMSLPPLLWAGNAVVGRLAVGSVPPLTLNFLRWLLAMVLLLPLGWHALREPKAIAQRWKYLLAVGLLGVGTYNSLQYLALVTTTPINVTLIAASMPVWMLGVGALFYGEHPTPRQLTGSVLSLAGVMLVIARGDPAALARVRFVHGDVYILVAVVAWAFYSWLLARPPESMRAPQRPDWDWAGFCSAPAWPPARRWPSQAPRCTGTAGFSLRSCTWPLGRPSSPIRPGAGASPRAGRRWPRSSTI